MSASHWADMGESTFVLGITCLRGVHKWLGRIPFLVCLYPVVLVYWLASRTARRASMDYLSRLRAAGAVLPRGPLACISLRHFGRFARTLLDKTLAISGTFPRDQLTVADNEQILQDIDRGQGGVILTAHIGCLELMQSFATHRKGLRINILVHTAHAARFNQMLARINPESRVTLLQVTTFNAPTAMLLAERVAAGEWIALAADRIPVSGDRILHIPFLGQSAGFPAGPYLIASLLGCPVYMLACLRSGKGYRAQIQRLAERIELPRSTRLVAMGAYAHSFSTWIEARLHESPLDWFNFYPFWDQTPNDIVETA